MPFFFVACSGGSSKSSSFNSNDKIDNTPNTPSTPDNSMREQICDIANGVGKQTRSVSAGGEAGAWGDCSIVRCNDGYILDSGTGTCIDSGKCTNDDLTYLNATAGVKYPKSNGRYTPCVPTTCKADYMKVGDFCLSPSTKTLRKIVGGQYHTCAILDDHSVRCWGRNNEGQTGGSDKAATGMVIVSLGLGQRAIDMDAGYEHTCAVLNNGKVKCWGKNDKGQTNGTADTSSDAMVMVPLKGNQKARKVITGWKHSCAILEDGGVQCWGSNSKGQTGDVLSITKVGVVSVDLGVNQTARALVAGWGHTCAILGSGRVRCWGYNNDQQTENSNIKESRMVTVDLGFNQRAKAIAAGWYHTCAILENESIKCWGLNDSGQTMNSLVGDNGMVSVDIDIGLNKKVKAITAGWKHTCILIEGGAVKCWGRNNESQTGATYRGSRTKADVNLGTGKTATLLLTGSDHNCALLDDGTVHCWGASSHARGNITGYRSICAMGFVNDNGNCRVPVAGSYADTAGVEQSCDDATTLTGSATVGGEAMTFVSDTTCPFTCSSTHIKAGTTRTCIPLARGCEIGYVKDETDSNNKYCRVPGEGKWANANGLEKVCSSISHSASLGGQALSVADANADSCSFTCADGFVVRGRECRPGISVKMVVGGYDHTCSLLDDGSVRCWGNNDQGQTGGSDTSSDATVRVDLGHEATSIAAGYKYTCAILDDGSVKCWGRNNEGQTTNPTASSVAMVSVDLGLGSTARVIATGEKHTCAILNEGNVKCWGHNDQGQTTNPTANSQAMVSVPLGGPAKAIAAGGKYTCAILNEGNVKCWGHNHRGQTMNPTSNSTAIVSVGLGEGFPKAKAIIAGSYHTCALLEHGDIRCWGYNNEGQTTNPTSGSSAMVFVDVGQRATELTGGWGHTCAILDDDGDITNGGPVKCWGANNHGQTGSTAWNARDMVMVHIGFSRKAIAIGAGTDHTCAVLDNGSIKCWGRSGNDRIKVPDYPSDCRIGYVKDAAQNYLCRVPEDRKYANLDFSEGSCDPVLNSVTLGGQVLPFARADYCPLTCASTHIKAGTTGTCVTTCETGYVKDDSLGCRKPAPGYYVSAGGIEGDCDPVANSALLGGQAVSVASANACSLVCKLGYVKDETDVNNRACRLPEPDKYANADGTEGNCNSITHSASLGGEAVGNIDMKSCPFTCANGYFKEGRACVTSCASGFVQDTTTNTCRVPAPGKYADVNGDEQACNATNSIAHRAHLRGASLILYHKHHMSFYLCRWLF